MVALLMRAEWVRFKRNRINLVLTAIVLLLLCASGVESGLSASQHRQDVAQRQAQWQERLELRQRAAQVSGREEKRDEVKAARHAFDFARDDPPPAPLPALGGLALSVRQFGLLSTDIRVSVESRHTDGRKSDQIVNPLLNNVGVPDFAAVVALVLPLAIIGLCHGLVQEAREQGIWRLVCAQTRAPWKVLCYALLLRFGIVAAIVFLASMLAFCIDPGSSATAFAGWMAAALVFSLTWTAVCGLFNAAPISSGASALGLLSLWLLCTFAIPSVLHRSAQAHAPSQSRLEAIVRIRAIQQDAEERMQALLADWYAQHPEHRHPTLQRHEWPVSFIPRYLEQDRRIRPLMMEFDLDRERRMSWIESWVWLSPGLALTLAADRLSGIDAARYARYLVEVNDFEDAWRNFFVPRIMSYRGVGASELKAVPVYANSLYIEPR